jgi:hypothetical protein
MSSSVFNGSLVNRSYLFFSFVPLSNNNHRSKCASCLDIHVKNRMGSKKFVLGVSIFHIFLRFTVACVFVLLHTRMIFYFVQKCDLCFVTEKKIVRVIYYISIVSIQQCCLLLCFHWGKASSATAASLSICHENNITCDPVRDRHNLPTLNDEGGLYWLRWWCLFSTTATLL